MNDYQPWKFNCKTCGGQGLTVTHVWTTLAGPDTERWQEWGALKDNHTWQFEFKEKIEKNAGDEVERGDFGKFAEDDSTSQRRSTKYSNRKATRKATSFMLIAQTVIGRSNLAGRNPTGAGKYFPWSVPTSFPGKSGRNPDI